MPLEVWFFELWTERQSCGLLVGSRDIFYRMGFVDREIVALSGGKKPDSV